METGHGREKVEINCPGCKRLLRCINVTVVGGKPLSNGERWGLEHCPVCRKTVEYRITGTKCRTNFK